MVGFIGTAGLAVLLALGAVLYQTEIPRVVILGFGIGRTVEPLSSWPYQCRRLQHPRLQACEDMWLSETTRQLFLACSDSLARREYTPAVARFNASGRGLNDAIIAMDIDKPTADGYEMRVLDTPGFFGTNGDGRLHLVGFTGRDDESTDGTISLWVVNTKPTVDLVSGELLDQSVSGANATIELFRTGPAATKLEHVKTFAHSQLATPNNVAAVGGKVTSFYYTNDHGLAKAGVKHALSPFLGTGDVSFCDDEGCKQVASGLKFPNGLVKGHDGLIYVPSPQVGGIDVYEPLPNNDLRKVDHININYGIDNLSVDAEGSIFAGAFPFSLQTLTGFADPLNVFPASTILKITKSPDGYKVEKVVEDGHGEILPCTTTAVHDASTGRLFLGGVFSPFIAVCEKIAA